MENSYRFTITAEQGSNSADIVRANALDVAEEIVEMLRKKHKGIVFHLDDVHRAKNLDEIIKDGEPF